MSKTDSNLMQNGSPINYYWRLPITSQRRAWLLGAIVFAWGWAITVFMHTPRMDNRFIPVVVAVVTLLFLKWLCAKSPHTLAISVFPDKIKVRSIKGESEIHFSDVSDARVRYRGVGFWDWNIVLFTANGRGFFIIPAGSSTDVVPQKLLAQIKIRIKAAQLSSSHPNQDASNA
jgi:hypothetical protein